MEDQYSNKSMLDMYIFETSQNIEHLEQIILSSEKLNGYTDTAVNEIFRIMHTIKGSSAMMLFNSISDLAHSMEDLFLILRENKQQNVDYSVLSDLILEGVDFIKVELQKIKNGDQVDGEAKALISNIRDYLDMLQQDNHSQINMENVIPSNKQQYFISSDSSPVSSANNAYKAIIFFQEGCEMENIRAYGIIHNLKQFADEIYYLPADIFENEDSIPTIKEQGFTVYVKVDRTFEEIKDFFMQTIFLENLEITQLENEEELELFAPPKELSVEESHIKVPKVQESEEWKIHSISAQSIISVNVEKLDKLMDLVGEMVIAEAMVTQNPDLQGLEIDNFHKAARQLHKITTELQDIVMSIRMIPLANTFQKMQRIVRDMCKKLGKEVNLKLIGEDTEVDKNIIEHISDPLMHLIRNSIDHGIEAVETREGLGKPRIGTVTLEAKNSGSDVLVTIKDDGRGLSKEKILQRARENGLLTKNEDEMSDKDIYSIIFLPGFSTKESISEFSGRGVGMDVVVKNIETVGGSISLDSTEGIGTTITLKIPLTLAIIDGMNVKVGYSRYTIPITSIKESFRPKDSMTFRDPDGNEMIMVRGQCYPILRLHEYYNIKTDTTDFTEGVLIMVEQEDKTICIFVDELLGQQQVVVKALPNYIKNTNHIRGLAGCTLLGDGGISLIIDIGTFLSP